ncbi:hypothetical protein [Rhodococcus kronopolitis]|uniref:Uncharacterized protein n=1 Tax=Rhodococcus kronopolitis TaxID=1460226 RepID=A0ABV9FVR5_9NOCA
MVDGVHCILIPEVALALTEQRRGWFAQMLSPARHSIAGMRKRSAERQSSWSPVSGTVAAAS